MTKKRPRRPLLSLPEYERVFRTIHGVLLNEEGDLSRSCLFFGLIGSAILRTHYRISANPVVGTAVFNLGGSRNDILAFATQDDGVLQSSSSGFHCWVEADGWVVDFMAPLFQEMLASLGHARNLGRKMFQKPTAASIGSQLELEKEGAFYCEPNPELTMQLVHGFTETPAYVDLVGIAVKWFQPPPKKMIETIGIGNARGEVKPVRLSPLRVGGAW